MKDGKFEKGDVTVLRSGGPQMTVYRVYYTEDDAEGEPIMFADCQWFDVYNQLNEGTFLMVQLMEGIPPK